jgi:hypothetical protein
MTEAAGMLVRFSEVAPGAATYGRRRRHEISEWRGAENP